MNAPGAILLAAGQSRRFGSDKRQAVGPWQGPLLHHVIRLYLAYISKIAVVIGADDEFGQQSCRLFGVTALVNSEATLGIGRSVAVGVGWAKDQDLTAAVVGLADMPWIPPDIITGVTRLALLSGQMVTPIWQGQRGFPRAIPASLFGQLSGLGGDRGASAVLDWTRALTLEAPDSAILQDIDLPADLSGPHFGSSA